jgi:hypothetical protein
MKKKLIVLNCYSLLTKHCSNLSILSNQKKLIVPTFQSCPSPKLFQAKIFSLHILNTFQSFFKNLFLVLFEVLNSASSFASKSKQNGNHLLRRKSLHQKSLRWLKNKVVNNFAKNLLYYLCFYLWAPKACGWGGVRGPYPKVLGDERGG